MASDSTTDLWSELRLPAKPVIRSPHRPWVCARLGGTSSLGGSANH